MVGAPFLYFRFDERYAFLHVESVVTENLCINIYIYIDMFYGQGDSPCGQTLRVVVERCVFYRDLDESTMTNWVVASG